MQIMGKIIQLILENQHKATLYEIALREIVCIICEQGYSVIPVLGDELADRALKEVQRIVKESINTQICKDQINNSGNYTPNC